MVPSSSKVPTSSYSCLDYPHQLTKCCSHSTFDWCWEDAEILHAIGYAMGGGGIKINHFNCVQGVATIISPNNESVVVLKQKKLYFFIMLPYYIQQDGIHLMDLQRGC